MILPIQGVFLIDRKFDFYRVEGFDSLMNCFATSAITLLDGEMVTHIPSKKQMYLIFDLIALNGKVLAPQPLKERLTTIGTGIILTGIQNWPCLGVVKVYRDAVAAKTIPEGHPFTLMGKQFVELPDLYKLFGMIKVVNGQRCCILS